MQLEMSRLSIRQLTRVVEADAHEGPVYTADEDALYFTTVPRGTTVAIKRLSLRDHAVTVVRPDANMANGMTLDQAGRLLVCEQGTHARPARISRLDRLTGTVDTVVDDWRGLRLNSPNDVVVRSDGTIWFTDPTYGFLQSFRPPPLAGDRVYCYDPRSDELTAVAESLDKPNGLAFSSDESVLYVGDSGAIHAPGDYDESRPRRIVGFDVDGIRLTNERVFADEIPGFPDGIKVDLKGRVYVSSDVGVLVYDTTGDLAGVIDVPNPVNFTFGGPRRDVLYVTTDDAIWAAVLDSKGA